MSRRYALLAAALLAISGCFTDPQKQLEQMQQMNDLADALTELNQRTAELQFTLDSLSALIAKQDTVLRRVANVTGVSYR